MIYIPYKLYIPYKIIYHEIVNKLFHGKSWLSTSFINLLTLQDISLTKNIKQTFILYHYSLNFLAALCYLLTLS